MRAESLNVVACLVVVSISFLACNDATSIDQIVSVDVTPADTAILVGASVELEATVQFQSGPGVPGAVLWTVSDSNTVRLVTDSSANATVIGLTRGGVQVVAAVDGIADTANVTVVMRGDVRWATGWAQGGRGMTALDEQGRVYVIRGTSPHELTALDPTGTVLFSEPTCNAGLLSPSVTLDGAAYVTGTACTKRHEASGVEAWTQAEGDVEAGVAIAADGSVLVPHSFADVYLSRFAVSGTEVWRDTLEIASGNDVTSAPAMASNGEIYLSWKGSGGFNWLSRFAPDGNLRWSVPISGQPTGTTPALVNDRIAVTHFGRLVVHDSTGALLWEQAFDGGSAISSPVIDAAGNYYVQSARRLLSYDSNGDLRWEADSLGCAQGSIFLGAPSLLVGNELVVACDYPGSGTALCQVRTEDGSLTWRSPRVGMSVRGSPTVAGGGTIYAAYDSGVVALWNDIPPLTQGWPTEGGNMHRQRRQ